MTTPRPVRATWHRLFWAWARGTFDRLSNARARREALFGRPDQAIIMAFGERTAGTIVLMAFNRYLSAFDRLAYYQRVVCQHIGPGGVRRDLDPLEDEA